MKLPRELTDRINDFALVGITEIQEMQWCLRMGLTPEVILTYVAKGVRDLKEMADNASSTWAPEHQVESDPFGLAGTSRWETSESTAG